MAEVFVVIKVRHRKKCSQCTHRLLRYYVDTISMRHWISPDGFPT